MTGRRLRRVESGGSAELRPAKRTTRASTGTPAYTHGSAPLSPTPGPPARDRDYSLSSNSSAAAPATAHTAPSLVSAWLLSEISTSTTTPLHQTGSASKLPTPSLASTSALGTPVATARRGGQQKDTLSREDMVAYGFVLVRAVSNVWYACPADQVCDECAAAGCVCIVEALEVIGKANHLRRLVCIPCRASHIKCSHATSTVGVTFDWIARLTTRNGHGIQKAAEEASRLPATNGANCSAYVLEKVDKSDQTLAGRKHNSAWRRRQGKRSRTTPAPRDWVEEDEGRSKSVTRSSQKYQNGAMSQHDKNENANANDNDNDNELEQDDSNDE